MSGIVYLVGAGPGDPGLMTRRSLELIAGADVILYDRLIPPARSTAPAPDAELRYVGKEPGAPPSTQEEINALLVELGRAGKRVVRLKGGDPFVFGRGGEEAEALAAAGVPFEVVPGVTAGVAAPAYAGIPVTHRDAGLGRRVRHRPRGPRQARESALDWDALARFPGTLVFYMGSEPAADRRAAHRARAAARTSPRPWWSAARCPGQRTVSGRSPRSPARGRGGRAAAGHHAGRARSPGCATGSPGSSAGRCTARWWPSPAPARRRAGWPRGCASWAPRWSRRRRSGSSRARDGELPTARRGFDLICFTSPNGVRLLLRRARRRRARARRRSDGRRHRPRHGARARAARHPRRRGARALRRRGAARGAAPGWSSPASACSWRAPPRRATCCPTACASAARRWTVLALYDTVAEPLATAQLRGDRAPTT